MKSASTEFNYPFTPLIGGRIKTLKQIHQHFKPDNAFRRRYFLSRLIASVLEPFRLSERWIMHKKIDRFNFSEDPLFILGHWRSGTTLLHNLLSADKQFGYCSTYQSLLPDLTLIHQTWLAPIMQWIMPRHRPADHVELNLNYPQEEEFALGNLVPWCFYYAWYFPRQFDYFLNQHCMRSSDNADLIKEWKQAYRKMIKTALLNTQGTIYLSKNPPNTFRLDLLKEVFPDARYIFIIRNPYEVFESAIRFAEGVLPTTQLQSYNKECIQQAILNLMDQFFTRYESTRHLINPEKLIEIKYESLIENPIEAIRQVYAYLNLGTMEHLVSEFQKNLENRSVKPFRYAFPKQTILQVNAIWKPIFTRFGYTQLDPD